MQQKRMHLYIKLYIYIYNYSNKTTLLFIRKLAQIEIDIFKQTSLFGNIFTEQEMTLFTQIFVS